MEDPVGTALTTCHDIKAQNFGLERLATWMSKIQNGDKKKSTTKYVVRKNPKMNNLRLYGVLILLLCGDIAPNPGPRKWKYPCMICSGPVKKNQDGLLCDDCNLWNHLKCLPDAISLSKEEYNRLGDSDENWFCYKCQLPDLSDSFFSPNETLNESQITNCDESEIISEANDCGPTEDQANYLHQCDALKEKYPKNCLFTYINVNSIRYKIHELKPVIMKLKPVLFAVAETKIDNTFHNGQFCIDGYHPPFRKDRSAHGGGLMVYIRSDIPCRQLDQPTAKVESISMEITIKKSLWNIIVLYKSPNKVSDHDFTTDMEYLCEKSTSLYDRTLLMGDLNYNLLDQNKSKPLNDIMDNFSMDNMVKEPTFISQHGSSLIDVALTNNTNYFQETATLDIGISDGHSMLCAVAKLNMPQQQAKNITYRSYKLFNKDTYRRDVQRIPFSSYECFDDPDDMLWAHNTLLTEVLNEHAPLKTKKIRPQQPPFMNKALRKSIMNKTRLRNRYLKTKRQADWEKYRIQRNITTQIRRKSIKQYFTERCAGGPRNEHFYKTIKPFLSAKHRHDSNLMIKDGVSLLTDPKKVCESMNNFFTNIANDIGNDKTLPTRDSYDTNKDFLDSSVEYHKDHPSVQSILKNQELNAKTFKFKPAEESSVSRIIKDLNPKKATGADCIPARALVSVHDIVAPAYTRLYNTCIQTASFPMEAKKSEVSPVYKDSALEHKNHRPVSILKRSSKILEKIMDNDMSNRWLSHI